MVMVGYIRHLPSVQLISYCLNQLVVLTLTDHCFLWNCITCKISQNIRHKNWSLINFRVCILQSRKPRNSGRQLHCQSKMSSVLASPDPRRGARREETQSPYRLLGGGANRRRHFRPFQTTSVWMGKRSENLAKFPAYVRPFIRPPKTP